MSTTLGGLDDLLIRALYLVSRAVKSDLLLTLCDVVISDGPYTSGTKGNGRGWLMLLLW